MKYNERKYDVFVLLGDAAAQPLWRWKRWGRVAAALSPVIAAARGPALVRSFQYENRKEVKFGRMAWGVKGQEKWVHGSPVNRKKCAEWMFLGVEVSAPLWAKCVRENKPPDMFFALTNLKLWGVACPAYNPVVLLATALGQGKQMACATEQAVSLLRDMLDAKLVLNKKRSWGKSWGRFAFTDSIQDMPGAGLFKAGIDRAKEATSKSFIGKWTSI